MQRYLTGYSGPGASSGGGGGAQVTTFIDNGSGYDTTVFDNTSTWTNFGSSISLDTGLYHVFIQGTLSYGGGSEPATNLWLQLDSVGDGSGNIGRTGQTTLIAQTVIDASDRDNVISAFIWNVTSPIQPFLIGHLGNANTADGTLAYAGVSTIGGTQTIVYVRYGDSI